MKFSDCEAPLEGILTCKGKKNIAGSVCCRSPNTEETAAIEVVGG